MIFGNDLQGLIASIGYLGIFGMTFAESELFFFQKKHLETAKHFYDRHGGKTLILARFMPAIRTFAPIVAGMAEMNYGSFITYNVIGGLLWSFGLTLLGFFLGSVIPDADKYLLPIIGIIILASVLPAVIHFVKDKRNSKA